MAYLTYRAEITRDEWDLSTTVSLRGSPLSKEGDNGRSG